MHTEIFRNIPPLLPIFFWYFAVLRNFPSPRQAVDVFELIFLSNRGLYIPSPVPGAMAFIVAVVMTLLISQGLWTKLSCRRRYITCWVVVYPLIVWWLLYGGFFGLKRVETRLWGGLTLTLIIASVGIAGALSWEILLPPGDWKTQAFVFLPQALTRVIPGRVNTIIARFKDISLVIIIGRFDLFDSVQQATVDPA